MKETAEREKTNVVEVWAYFCVLVHFRSVLLKNLTFNRKAHKQSYQPPYLLHTFIYIYIFIYEFEYFLCLTKAKKGEASFKTRELISRSCRGCVTHCLGPFHRFHQDLIIQDLNFLSHIPGNNGDVFSIQTTHSMGSRPHTDQMCSSTLDT